MNPLIWDYCVYCIRVLPFEALKDLLLDQALTVSMRFHRSSHGTRDVSARARPVGFPEQFQVAPALRCCPSIWTLGSLMTQLAPRAATLEQLISITVSLACVQKSHSFPSSLPAPPWFPCQKVITRDQGKQATRGVDSNTTRRFFPPGSISVLAVID